MRARGRQRHPVRLSRHGVQCGGRVRARARPGHGAAQRARAQISADRAPHLAWIWLGDPARADPAAIPDLHWVDDPAWCAVTGYHHFAANYQLVNDNLLDLSHESFVHEETIGNESVAESPCHVTLVGNTVRAHRDMLNIEAPPFY